MYRLGVRGNRRDSRRRHLETLRIAWLNQFDPLHPWAGGAERHIYEVSKRLVAKGHSVTIFGERFRGGPREQWLDGFRISRPAGRFGIHLWAQTHFARDRQYDMVVQDLSKILPWQLGATWDTPSVAFVRHLNGSLLLNEVPVAAPTLWATERLYSWWLRSTPVITEAASTASSLSRRGIPSGSISLVPPGVDHAIYTPGHGDRSPYPLVLYAGRLKRYKRVDLAIRAFAEVRRHVEACRMVVVGDGADASRLHRVAAGAGLSQFVEFTGKVDTSTLVDYYRNAWVHVQPSSAEGWGYTVMEAAACGTPTVAIVGTALEESVGPECKSYLARSADALTLGSSLERCLNDMRSGESEFKQKMVQYAMQFDWEASATQFLDVLKRHVGSPRGRNPLSTVVATPQPESSN